MQLRKAFKFEIMPNGNQIRRIKQFCGCSRFVFNRALAWQKELSHEDLMRFESLFGEVDDVLMTLGNEIHVQQKKD
ncbi:hypothetical protein JP35_10220 [Gallibacterium anatis]|nr:helix-turn-helix domain-containing protein [Gallibacterium anatis]KGQ36683.1 hypothetical protein JP35_10220 [Gallibacterium anatis]